MGNYRFRLSDMIPNAWFYKLRDMSKTKSTSNHHKKPPPPPYYSSSTTTAPPEHHHFSQPRTSFYYTPKVGQFHNSPTSKHHKIPHFHDPPRKSSKRSRPAARKTIYKPSPKHTHSTQTLQDFFHSPTTNTNTNSESPSSESTQSGLATASWCTSCTCRVSSSTSDIIIDVNDNSVAEKIDNSDLTPEIELKLPPIITKPAKSTPRNMRQYTLSGKKVKENGQTPARKSASGVKLRANSPKLAASKRLVQKKKNLSESFAIVKSSFDPQKDFVESMREMIVENNIRASKDLEELLACYLSLNSDEYHDVIVKAFEQIWFSLPDL